MVEFKTAKMYERRMVGIELTDGNFYKGFVKKVSKKDLTLEFQGMLQSYTLDSIRKIRELKKNEKH